MGIYKRPDAPEFWMSLQRDGERIRMSTQTSDLRLAQEMFAAWQAELARTRWLGPRPVAQDHTVEHLVQQYLTTVTPRKSFHSQRHDRRVLTRFSLMWGRQLVSDLSPETIEAYMVHRQRSVCLAQGGLSLRASLELDVT